MIKTQRSTNQIRRALSRSKILQIATTIIITSLTFCTAIEAIEKKRLRHGPVIERIISSDQSLLQNDDFPQYRPSVYGEAINLHALDTRCNKPENTGCRLLGTRTNIKIKYCTPPHYHRWFHNFLREQVENSISYPLFDAQAIGIRQQNGECPDFRSYNPGRNNIYITYDRVDDVVGSEAIGATLPWTFSGFPFQKQAYANIAIDDQAHTDFLDNHCGGKTDENYRILMEETFLHELWAHGFTLGHNPNGDATQAFAPCPNSTAKKVTNDEIMLLGDYIP